MNSRRDQLEAWEGETKTNQKTGAFSSQMPLKIVKNSACIRNDGSKTNFASLCLYQVVMNFSKRKIFTNLTQQTIAQELVSLMAARKRWTKNWNGNQSKTNSADFSLNLPILHGSSLRWGQRDWNYPQQIHQTPNWPRRSLVRSLAKVRVKQLAEITEKRKQISINRSCFIVTQHDDVSAQT